MKRTFVIIAFALLTISTITSCVSSRAGGGGCKATKGYIGYGR